MAESGRRLVGAEGFNCVQCHSIAGRDSTDLPGPDLVAMVERLRYDYYVGWMQSPRQIRPATRMPTYFYDGRSGVTELDGDGPKQIDAIWTYLSQGEFLALPDGVAGPGGLELEVDVKPVVFRTFMTDVGPRAIACGFPQQIHYAFDADRCVLQMVWVGRFLNAGGVWAARGGSVTNPDQDPAWVRSDDDIPTLSLPAESSEATLRRFRGYRLDDEGRPIFQYELASAGTVIEVSEQPIPLRRDGKAMLLRRFVLEGSPGSTVLVEGREVSLDDNGTLAFDLELTW